MLTPRVPITLPKLMSFLKLISFLKQSVLSNISIDEVQVELSFEKEREGRWRTGNPMLFKLQLL